MSYYKKHIFICTNQKISGNKCCFQGGAEPLFKYAKKQLQRMQKHGKGLFRVSSTGCLGRCSEGPGMVIYPDNIWYRFENEKDIDEIIEQHLIGGKPVERLLMAAVDRELGQGD